jgi:hypothetical protein
MLAPINIEDSNDEVEVLPKPLEARVREAQLEDVTTKRIIHKLRARDRRDHEVTLAHAIDREGVLYIDNKL